MRRFGKAKVCAPTPGWLSIDQRVFMIVQMSVVLGDPAWGGSALQTLNPEPQPLHPEPRTLNPEPQPLNPEP